MAAKIRLDKRCDTKLRHSDISKVFTLQIWSNANNYSNLFTIIIPVH